MSKLRDFQVSASQFEAQKAVNEALFATSEPIRLWLRARRFDAPFHKLVVTLRDTEAAGQWHGHVMVALGICQVTEAVDVPALPRHALDHRWVLGVVRHALSCVVEKTSWRSSELEAHLDELAAASPPVVYMFEKLSARDRATGAVCVPWFRSRPGLFEVGVRVSRAGELRDVTAVRSTSPIYLEDTFPFVSTRIKGSQLIFLDKNKNALAAVEIADVSS